MNDWCEKNPDYELIYIRKKKRLQKQSATIIKSVSQNHDLQPTNSVLSSTTSGASALTAASSTNYDYDEDTVVSRIDKSKEKSHAKVQPPLPPKIKEMVKEEDEDDYGRETIDTTKKK